MSTQDQLAEIGALTLRHRDAKILRLRLAHRIEEAGRNLSAVGGLLVDVAVIDTAKVAVALENMIDKSDLKTLLSDYAVSSVEISSLRRQLEEANAL